MKTMLRSPEMRFQKLRHEYTSSSSRFQIFRLLRRRDVAIDARGEKDGYGGENEIRAGKDEDSSTEFQRESQLLRGCYDVWISAYAETGMTTKSLKHGGLSWKTLKYEEIGFRMSVKV
ncbi:unnamed protein product [Vicia faba]|uniref:Uncharacterized protein n=1 Tax=Vicia faba TaxID=3906 RepID=A0AAV1A692_VICFA|nr:unnamed protein product [Vicia faba]